MTETAAPRTGEELVSIAQDALDIVTQRLIETRKGVTAEQAAAEAVAVLLVGAAKGQVEIARVGGMGGLTISRALFVQHAECAYNGRMGAAINEALARK